MRLGKQFHPLTREKKKKTYRKKSILPPYRHTFRYKGEVKATQTPSRLFPVDAPRISSQRIAVHVQKKQFNSLRTKDLTGTSTCRLAFISYLERPPDAFGTAFQAGRKGRLFGLGAVPLLDVALAAELYARRQKLGEEAIGYAHEIKIYALRKLGEMLKETERAKGRAGPGRGKAGIKAGPAFTEAETLSELGLDKKTSSLAQQIASLPARDLEAAARAKELKR